MIDLAPMSQAWLARNQPEPQHTRCQYYADEFVVHPSDCECNDDDYDSEV